MSTRLRLKESETRAERLPEVCMACGAPAPDVVRKGFSWSPPWVAVTILLGLLPYVLIAVLLTKRMTVEVPLCEQHRGHFWKRTLVTYLSVLAWLGLGFFAFVLAVSLAPKRDEGAAVGLACLFFGLSLIALIVVIAVVQQTAIRPKEITDRDITLAGVHDDFADALDAMREEPRSRRYQNDDDDDDSRRPRRRPAPRDERDSYREPRDDGYREGRRDERTRRQRRDDDFED